MNRLWVCPNCAKGVRAPGRLRKNDVRRFCYPCSQGKGVLVERVCPALERKRSVAADRAKKKAKRKREKTKAKAKMQYVVGDPPVDCMEEMKRLVRLKAFGRKFKAPRGWYVPKLEVRRRDDNYSSGVCFGSGSGRFARIVITCGRWQPPSGVKAVLLHELCHAAATSTSNGLLRMGRGEDPHGQEFKLRFAEAAAEAYGVDIAPCQFTRMEALHHEVKTRLAKSDPPPTIPPEKRKRRARSVFMTHANNHTGLLGFNAIAADPRVVEVTGEKEGGYWADLEPGYISYDGCTQLHEWTVTDMKAALDRVEKGEPE